MTQKLLSFGDSWPNGAELLPGEQSYGDLIAQNLGLSHKNYSQPGTSIEKLVLQLKEAIQTEEVKNSLAIFTLTSPTRSMWVDTNCNYREIHVRGEDPVSRAYYRYMWSDELDYYRINTIVLALQRMCQQYLISDYYVRGITNVSLDYPGIDTSKIYKTSLTELLGCQIPINSINMDFCVDRQNQYIHPNVCHPNQRGHSRIATDLYEWINSINN